MNADVVGLRHMMFLPSEQEKMVSLHKHMIAIGKDNKELADVCDAITAAL